MSKTKLKKYLQTLDREQLSQVILDMYDARKEAKEYLEFFMDPDIDATLEKEKKNLSRLYFTPQGRPRARMSVKAGNDLVADFIRLDVPPEAVADLMVHHVEVLASRLVMRHLIRETAWTSVVNLFQKAVDYINSYNLMPRFERRIEKIIEYCGNAPSWLRVPERMRECLSA